MTITDRDPDYDLTGYDTGPTPPADTGRSVPSKRTRVELMDGTVFDVRVTQRDYIQWDLFRSRKKLPTYQEAPFLARAFVTYAAARREGLTDLKWEGPGSFQETVADIEDYETDDSDVAHPSRKGRGAGRS